MKETECKNGGGEHGKGGTIAWGLKQMKGQSLIESHKIVNEIADVELNTPAWDEAFAYLAIN